MENKTEMPEKLEFETVAKGDSQSSGSKRLVLKNKEFGVTLVVTYAQPYPDIGLQSFSCAALPHWSWDNFNSMRKTYNEKVATQ